MRKRKHLVWVMGLALALGVSAIAMAAGNTDNTQSMAVTVTPSKQSKNKFGNAKLRSLTTTGSTTTGAFAITPVDPRRDLLRQGHQVRHRRAFRSAASR